MHRVGLVAKGQGGIGMGLIETVEVFVRELPESKRSSGMGCVRVYGNTFVAGFPSGTEHDEAVKMAFPGQLIKKTSSGYEVVFARINEAKIYYDTGMMSANTQIRGWVIETERGGQFVGRSDVVGFINSNKYNLAVNRTALREFGEHMKGRVVRLFGYRDHRNLGQIHL
jgi:hypothetical protein